MAGQCLALEKPVEELDVIEQLAPQYVCDTVARLRFVPESYLAACRAGLDRGLEYLLYFQMLINEEEGGVCTHDQQ